MFLGFPSFRTSHFRGSSLRVVPSKNYAFSTNYHACIAMPTWRRCAPPILFWPWPPYSLLLRSFLTWIFFVDPHWSVPLCLQCQAKAMSFHQIILCPARNNWRDIMFPGRPSVRHTLGVPLCVQRPAKTMPFQQIIMHALQCQHDVDVHLLFCFDLHM